MSKKKSRARAFREAVLHRDGNRCIKCDATRHLDAHRIVDPSLMPNLGLVPENGITLCPECHVLAEMFHETGEPWPGYEPETLYALIGSNRQLALQESRNLGAR